MTTEEKSRRNRERYEWYKAHGICVKCGRRDAFNGRVECEYCIERRYLYSKQEKRVEAARHFANSRYHARLEAGVCPYCGKAPIHGEYKSCESCRKKLKQYRKIRQHETEQNFVSEKESWMCRMGQCQVPAAAGETLCAKHSQQIKTMIDRSISARKLNGHAWIQPMMGRGRNAGQGI